MTTASRCDNNCYSESLETLLQLVGVLLTVAADPLKHNYGQLVCCYVTVTTVTADLLNHNYSLYWCDNNCSCGSLESYYIQ